jgi:glycosyltransferase involved in cell wall biosynthesis
MNTRRRLKVCIVMPKLALGGAEVQVLDQLRTMDRSAVEAHICCLAKGDAAMEEEARSYGSSVFHLDFHLRSFPWGLGRFVRYLRSGKFDVVHCHLPPADIVGRLAGWLAGVPVRITTEHGRGLWKSRGYLGMEKALNHITDLKLCVSKDILELRATREGTPRRKLVYLPNGVDLARFDTPGGVKEEVMGEFAWGGDDPLIVSLGRLVEEKAYPLLVEAVASLVGPFPQVRCIIAGEGECRREIEACIGSFGMGDHVALPGIRKDVPRLLKAADVFVLSSTREGLPVSLIEAMASATAIVATDVGGIPDAVSDGRNGLLVPPGEPQALAGAVERLLGDGDLRKRLGGAARETAGEHFSLEYVVRRTEELYREVFLRKTS